MKKCFIILFSFCISISVLAQYNGFALSSAGIRIYDASASVLSEINGIDGKENRLIQIGNGISQSDFESICNKCKWIKRFSIEGCEVSDISALKKLKQLESISLKNLVANDTVSLAPLAEIESLKEILVIGILIKDYESLSTLTEIESISFENSPLASLGFMAQMKGLKKLILAGKNHTFTNYDTLSKLQQISFLDVSYNAQATADNLDVFSDVITLTKVDVSHCENLKSLGFLYGSTSKLQEFYAIGCPSIGNFDMLIRCQNLKKVDLSYSSAKNIAFMNNKLNVKDLRISHTQVSSIAEIVQSINLERLDVSYTQIDNISMLSEMTKLKRLNVSHTNISNVSALSKCISLSDFDCSYTQVSSLEGMETCEKLSKINIGNSMVVDLRPLYGAKKIVSIVVNEGTSQADLDALKRRSPLIIIDFAKQE